MIRLTLYSRPRLQRGFSLIEALLATVILLLLFLAWGSGMIIATDGENKAATHTQAIATANEILEWMRRDPGFWNSPGEYVAGSCPHCWPATYNDTVGVTAPQPCSAIIVGASPNCSFNWLALADAKSSDLAHLAVVVFYKGANHQTERYTVMGMARKT